MAEGVRIRHASERNCIYTLVSSRTLRAPMQCPTCGREHVQKTYHIRLDDQGTGIVSPEVWAKLRRIPDSGFTNDGTVGTPPAQGVSVRSQLLFNGSEMTEVAAGVRVTHPTLRNERLVLVDADRPYGVPYACPICGLVHTHKTYHLELDAEGGTTVSAEVAATIERLGMTAQPTETGPRVVAAGTG